MSNLKQIFCRHKHGRIISFPPSGFTVVVECERCGKRITKSF